MARQGKQGSGKSLGSLDADSIDLAHIDERRAAMRQATFKAGEILTEGGERIECIVRNVSESGCLIKIDNAGALPQLVCIRIDRDKPPRPAEIVWRSTTLAGAIFVREPS